MNTEIVKELMIVSLRNGVELSIEKDSLEELVKRIEQKKVIFIGDSVVNTADIVGIFTPQQLEDVVRRKNGQWKDVKTGKWYNKGDHVCPTCKAVIPYGKYCGKCW